MATSNEQRVATRLGESALTRVRGAASAPLPTLSPNAHGGPRSRFARFSGCCWSHTRSNRVLRPVVRAARERP